MDTRVIPCGACGDDGGHESVEGIDPFRSCEIVRWHRCLACDGIGEVEVEMQPIELEDLP